VNLDKLKRRIYLFFMAMCVGLFAPVVSADDAINPTVTIGSKKFTESVILGEMVSLLAEHAGGSVTHRRELGGTRVLWNALVDGSIDMYPEYTGTLREEIFIAQVAGDEDALRKLLATHGVRMSEPMGFNNTYAIGMDREQVQSIMGPPESAAYSGCRNQSLASPVNENDRPSAVSAVETMSTNVLNCSPVSPIVVTIDATDSISATTRIIRAQLLRRCAVSQTS